MLRVANLFIVIFLCFNCQHFSIAFKCGQSKHSEGFIIGGTFVSRGSYPWIAALVNLNTQKFFCAGTLITNIHAVTAAHCINKKGTQDILLPQDVAVLLGKHNLNFKIERGSVAIYVDRIHIHPDWRYHTDNYDADIAILKLQRSVSFNAYIFPICWPSRADMRPIFEGTVVGWGQSENEENIQEEIPKELHVESITNEACFLDYFQFAIISSNRTFCAGMENAGPCFGDSGGGLYVNKDSKWIIRGIVSSSFVEKGKCDVTKYSVYTDVIKYTYWAREILYETVIIRPELNDIIEPDNGDDNEHHITIDCSYIYGENPIAIPVKRLYLCSVGKFDFPQKNSVAHIHGKHRSGLSNQDVEEFYLESKSGFFYIPMGIGRIFPNLELFFIGHGSLKSIERQNFEGMSKVSSLFLGYNDLVDLPKDGFYELFNTEALFIDNNKVQSLHRDTLVKMPKLKKFIAYNNQIKYLDGGIFRRNSQLQEINLRNNGLTSIGVNFKPYKSLQVLSLKENQCIDTQITEEILIDYIQDLIDKNCEK